MDIQQYIRSARLSASGISDVGQVRKANEDNCGYARIGLGELFVVCDGMGGHVGGATASRISVDAIIGRLGGENPGANVPEALSTALRYANTQVLGTASENPSLRGMGTTACIVLIQDSVAWIAHVGDSRIYLFDANDHRLHRITRDHSLVQQLVDSGDLADREAEHHPQKNIILSALGIRESLNPDVARQSITLVRGDRILICSDGLSGMVDDDELERTLSNIPDTDVAVASLMSKANAPGKGRDNITVQLIDVLEGQDTARTYKDYNPSWRQTAPVGAGASQPQEPSAAAPVTKRMSVGRAEDNSYVIARPQVSKHHLEMVQEGAAVTVRDLGSLNGTFVNGVRLTDARVLRPGDVVMVDSVTLPWEEWFVVRPSLEDRFRSGREELRDHADALRAEREEVRRRVEAKLSRLKGMIKNK